MLAVLNLLSDDAGEKGRNKTVSMYYISCISFEFDSMLYLINVELQPKNH